MFFGIKVETCQITSNNGCELGCDIPYVQLARLMLTLTHAHPCSTTPQVPARMTKALSPPQSLVDERNPSGVSFSVMPPKVDVH